MKRGLQCCVFFLLFFLVSISHGQKLKDTKVYKNTVYGIDMSQDGSLIFIAGKDSVGRILNIKTGQSTSLIGHNNSISSVSYNSKHRTVLTGSYDNTAILWDMEGKVVNELIGHEGGVVNISQRGELIGTVSRDKTAKVWDRQGELILTLEGHTEQVNAIEFVPERDWIITASFDGSIKIWDYEGNLLNNFNLQEEGIRAIEVVMQKERIIAGHKNGKISIIDFEGRVINTIVAHERMISDVDLMGENIISSSMDGYIRFWSWDGLMVKEFLAHDSYVSGLAVSGNIISSSSGDKTVKIWEWKAKRYFSLKKVVLTSPDVENLSNWYAKYLQFTILKSVNDKIVLGKNGFELELVEDRDAIDPDSVKFTKGERYFAGFRKYGFAINNIDSLFEYVKSNELPTHGGIINDSQLGARSFILVDPDGNYIQFFEKKGRLSLLSTKRDWFLSFLMIITTNFNSTFEWYSNYGFEQVSNYDNVSRQIFQRSIFNGEMLIEVAEITNKVASKVDYPEASKGLVGIKSIGCSSISVTDNFIMDAFGNMIQIVSE